MDEIIKNLKNWQNLKTNSTLITNLLSNASYFKIDCSAPIDTSKYYHFYPALEKIKNTNEGCDSNNYNFLFYMISMDNDNKKFIDDNKKNINLFINRFNVINKFLIGEDTEISKDEALRRKKRWKSDEIKKWISNNEVFNVIKIPSEDFKFNDKNIALQGHFGMKNSIDYQNDKSSTTDYSPDIMIYQIDSKEQTEYFFDMAKLSPPYRSSEQVNEFSLLKYNM